MNFKRIISMVLSLVLVLSCQGFYAFATEEETHSIMLAGTFNNWEGTAMETEDNIVFSTSVELEKGNYQFYITDNGNILGHPGTVKDTTNRVSSEGWSLNEDVKTKCTLVASGGTYSFTYNLENNKLKVTKKGLDINYKSGDDLKINLENNTITAHKGDTLSYTVMLKADKVFEDIQVVVSFDESKLELKNTTASLSCPYLKGITFNCDNKGTVAVNASEVSGHDFTSEKVLLTLDFAIMGSGETAMEFTVQDMTASGGKDSYYFYSNKVSDGADFRLETKITEPTKPTEPATTTAVITTTTVITEPAETTTATDVTEPMETTNATDVTKPVETTAEAINTTTTSEDTSSTEVITTDATESSSTAYTTSAQTTSPIESDYEMGDVNRDSKLNIRDATLIQKHLAKLEEFDAEQTALADVTADAKVSIKDVTYIQKKIAHLI